MELQVSPTLGSLIQATEWATEGGEGQQERAQPWASANPGGFCHWFQIWPDGSKHCERNSSRSTAEDVLA